MEREFALCDEELQNLSLQPAVTALHPTTYVAARCHASRPRATASGLCLPCALALQSNRLALMSAVRTSFRKDVKK
jgi:hypothetical protein